MVRTQPVEQGLHAGLFYVVAAILLLNTGAFGGVHPPVIFLSHVLILFGTLINAGLLIAEPSSWRLMPGATKFSFVLFAALTAYAFVQCAGGYTWLNRSLPGTVGRFETYASAVSLAYYGLFFWICVTVFGHRAGQRRMIALGAWLAIAVTLFGLLQKMSGSQIIYGFFDAGRSTFFGPFLYENNFGAFLILLAPMSVAMTAHRILKAYKEWSAETVKHAWVFGQKLFDSGAFFFLFMTAATLAGSYLSGSRSAALILSGIALLAAALVGLRRKRSALFYAVVGGSALAVCWVLFVVAAGSWQQDFAAASLNQQLEIRKTLWVDALIMFRDKPLFGYGFGTFWLVANRYLRMPTEESAYDHPNNEYAELLSCGGVAAAAIVAAFFAVTIGSNVRRHWNSETFWPKLMALQSGLALLGLALSVFFDMHLRLPVIAYLTCVQIAIFAQARSAASHTEDGTERGGAFQNRLIALALCASVLLLVKPAHTIFRAELLSEHAETIESVSAALRARSDNGELQHRMARLQYLRADRTGDPVKKKQAFALAIDHAKKSLEAYPTNAHYWYTLGQLEYFHGDRKSGIEAMENAVHWSPRNRAFAAGLLSLYSQEHARVASTVKKDEYWRKTVSTYRSLMSHAHPPADDDLKRWMLPYDAALLAKLKAI